MLLESDFGAQTLGGVLEEWDVSDVARRGAALTKQRTEYSSVKNEKYFAMRIMEALL